MAVYPAGDSITISEIKEAYNYFKNYLMSFFRKEESKTYTIGFIINTTRISLRFLTIIFIFIFIFCLSN